MRGDQEEARGVSKISMEEDEFHSTHYIPEKWDEQK